MRTRAKGVAFEKLTLNENKKEEFGWKDAIVQLVGAVIVTGLIFFFANLLLGLN